MDITIDTREAIQKLDPTSLDKAIDDALNSIGRKLIQDVKVYPPPKPTYQQTGTLKRAWTQELERRVLTIGNNVAYGPYVQDDTRQAWMHRGRWRTTRDIAEKRTPDIKRLFEDALQRWARRERD